MRLYLTKHDIDKHMHYKFVSSYDFKDDGVYKEVGYRLVGRRTVSRYRPRTDLYDRDLDAMIDPCISSERYIETTHVILAIYLALECRNINKLIIKAVATPSGVALTLAN